MTRNKGVALTNDQSSGTLVLVEYASTCTIVSTIDTSIKY